MVMKKFTVYRTEEYYEWFNSEPPKSRLQIQDRILKIEEEGYFGNHKFLGDGLWELKFNDGRRIYYVVIQENNVLLILGGNKNGQSKDIRQAKRIFSKAKRT
jgi:putative addiction module killer protein